MTLKMPSLDVQNSVVVEEGTITSRYVTFALPVRVRYGTDLDVTVPSHTLPSLWGGGSAVLDTKHRRYNLFVDSAGAFWLCEHDMLPTLKGLPDPYYIMFRSTAKGWRRWQPRPLVSNFMQSLAAALGFLGDLATALTSGETAAIFDTNIGPNQDWIIGDDTVNPETYSTFTGNQPRGSFLTTTPPTGWQNPNFDDSSWVPAVALPAPDLPTTGYMPDVTELDYLTMLAFVFDTNLGPSRDWFVFDNSTNPATVNTLTGNQPRGKVLAVPNSNGFFDTFSTWRSPGLNDSMWETCVGGAGSTMSTTGTTPAVTEAENFDPRSRLAYRRSFVPPAITGKYITDGTLWFTTDGSYFQVTVNNTVISLGGLGVQTTLTAGLVQEGAENVFAVEFNGTVRIYSVKTISDQVWFTAFSNGLTTFYNDDGTIAGSHSGAGQDLFLVNGQYWFLRINDQAITRYNSDWSSAGADFTGIGNVPSTGLQVGSEVWITIPNGNSIFRFDAATFTHLGTISGNGLSAPTGQCIVGTQVWVGNGNETISRFNFDTTSAGTPLMGNGMASSGAYRGVAVIGSQVWTTNNLDHSISRFHTDGTSAGTKITGNGLWKPAPLAATANKVFVTGNNNSGFNSICCFDLAGNPVPILDGVVVQGVEFRIVPTYVDLIAPNAPTLTNATQTGLGELTVTWTAPSGAPASSYIVTDSTLGILYTGSGVTAVLTGLSAGTYTLTVTAVNAAGSSVPSNAITVAVGPAATGATINNGTPSGSCMGDGTCTVSLVGTSAGGASVTLTATSNHDVGPTPWVLSIFDELGNDLADAGSGTTCTVTVTEPYGGIVHTYHGYLSEGNTPDGATNAVTVSWT